MLDRFEHFSYAIVEINKHWHKLANDEMEKYGLKAPHSVYIVALDKNNKNGLTASQICEYTGRDKADVSRMMGILEKKGLVTKEGTNQNLYRGVFKLTKEGLSAAQKVRRSVNYAVKAAGKALSDDEREQFYKSLDLIVEGLRELSANGIPE